VEAVIEDFRPKIIEKMNKGLYYRSPTWRRILLGLYALIFLVDITALTVAIVALEGVTLPTNGYHIQRAEIALVSGEVSI
jgi:hypothetical protein